MRWRRASTAWCGKPAPATRPTRSDGLIIWCHRLIGILLPTDQRQYLAYPEASAALRIVLGTVPRVSRTCEHFSGCIRSTQISAPTTRPTSQDHNCFPYSASMEGHRACALLLLSFSLPLSFSLFLCISLSLSRSRSLSLSLSRSRSRSLALALALARARVLSLSVSLSRSRSRSRVSNSPIRVSCRPPAQSGPRFTYQSGPTLTYAVCLH